MIRRRPRLGRARIVRRWSIGWIVTAEWLGFVVELHLIRRIPRQASGDR